MEDRHEPALVMFDGGVASVVAAWLELHAAEADEHASLSTAGRRERGSTERGVGTMTRGGAIDGASLTPAAAPRLWVLNTLERRPVATDAAPGDREDSVGARVVRLDARAGVAHAASLLASLGPLSGPMFEPSPRDAMGVRHALALRLVDAAFGALSVGLRRVVWPLQCAGVDRAGDMPGGSRSPDLDSLHGSIDVSGVSDAWDKATLVSQLASLDTPGVLIETPFLDLSDSDLLDLAMDIGAPIEASWVCQNDVASREGRECGVCAGCLRWLAAVRGASGRDGGGGVVDVRTRAVSIDAIKPRRAGDPPDSTRTVLGA